MKKRLFVFALGVLVLPFAPLAKSQEVSIDFFYNNLNGGSWIEVGNYGYCWQPDVAVSDPSWRPYSDGYWAYTDLGWTWVSYEDYGWATYHYGRWVRLADYGWVWRPGYEWGPAWVSWRFGGGYCGWAPLPPETEVVYESRPLTGHLDVEFDIGPAYYNFVDVRYIGEPVLRDRIFAPSQNVTYINQTVNVTNITYNNNTVYNYGPDYNALSARSSRPIQRLNIERQQNVDLSTAAKSGALTKVQGDKLVVAAPTKLQKPAKPIAPPTVKTKVAQAKIDKGWTGVDPNAQAQIKQKIKTENPKNIPPPTGAAGQASPATAASPMTSAAPATSASPFERGKQKGKAGQRPQPNVAASPGFSPATVPASPSPAAHGKERKGKPGEQLGATPPVGGGATTTPPGMPPRGGKKKGEFERAVPSQTPAQPGGPPEAQGGRHKGPPAGAQSPAATSTPFSPGGPGGPPEAQGGRHKGPPAGAQPAASAPE